jgi:hypothetical protein
MTVSTPISPRNAHEERLANTAHTKAHKNKVLPERLTKTIALPVAGGVGEAAMNGGIQDVRAVRGNSFHHFPRNLSPYPWFHARVRNEKPTRNSELKTIMKTTTIMTLAALIGTGMLATAQDEPQRPKRPHGPPPPEVVKEFDKDGDGKLSDAERKTMREAMQARMEARRKEMLEKFDKDKDGKLSDEERTAMREAHKAQMLEKYDTDKDGKLSEEERKAMPKPPRRQGGPRGKRGPGGPGGPEAPPAE